MMNLPFLKRKKGPRQQEPLPDKDVGLSGDEELHHQVMSEFMDAHESRDPKMFRKSLQAMVMNHFNYKDEPDGK